MFKFYFLLVITILSTNSLANSIVVLGDSISAAYGIPYDKGWVNLLQKKPLLQSKNYTVINESISGDTTAGGLTRIKQILRQHQPNIVLLELGANDGLRGFPPALIKKNLTELIHRSQQSGAIVMLLGMRIPPNYGKRYADLFYNIYLELAKEPDVYFVPFIMDGVVLVPEMMQDDGLHPNTKAQPIIADKIWTYLTPLL